MADKKLVEILVTGAVIWNEYRQKNHILRPDLSGVDLARADLAFADLSQGGLRDSNLSDADLHATDLSGAKLSGAKLALADLRWADLSGADLSGADLSGATLVEADLSEADLRGANLHAASLGEANLSGANLSEAYMIGADLRGVNVTGADLSRAECWETLFVNVRLGGAKGLELLKHYGPSVVDHRTLTLNPSLPLEFLRGCGLPDFIIENRHVLYGDPIQFYSCFISYSSADQNFAERLYNDLQGKGIRCWFAPEDLKTGDRFRERINEAIRIHDKLLLILSVNSIQSDWVETEVEKAFAEERRRSKDSAPTPERPTVLFPIRVDDEIRTTKMAWADHIRNTRHIGDFTRWKDHDAYQKAFERLLRDLRASGAAVSESEKEPSA